VKSVADELRARSRRALAQMSPAERLALALRLGDDDADLFGRARGLSRDEAVRQLRAQRQRGRRPSRAASS
jgi:hypothetical protein